MDVLVRVREKVDLKDTYTEKSFRRHPEIGETTFSKLEKSITGNVEVGTNMEFLDRNAHLLYYRLRPEQNSIELTIIESSFVTPHATITAQFENPSDIGYVYENMKFLIEATIASLKELDKLSE